MEFVPWSLLRKLFPFSTRGEWNVLCVLVVRHTRTTDRKSKQKPSRRERHTESELHFIIIFVYTPQLPFQQMRGNSISNSGVFMTCTCCRWQYSSCHSTMLSHKYCINVYAEPETHLEHERTGHCIVWRKLRPQVFENNSANERMHFTPVPDYDRIEKHLFSSLLFFLSTFFFILFPTYLFRRVCVFSFSKKSFEPVFSSLFRLPQAIFKCLSFCHSIHFATIHSSTSGRLLVYIFLFTAYFFVMRVKIAPLGCCFLRILHSSRFAFVSLLRGRTIFSPILHSMAVFSSGYSVTNRCLVSWQHSRRWFVRHASVRICFASLFYRHHFNGLQFCCARCKSRRRSTFSICLEFFIGS